MEEGTLIGILLTLGASGTIVGPGSKVRIASATVLAAVLVYLGITILSVRDNQTFGTG